jgi:hypothetical protein
MENDNANVLQMSFPMDLVLEEGGEDEDESWGWDYLVDDVMTLIARVCDPFTLNRLARTSMANYARFPWRFNFMKASFAERRRVAAFAPVRCLGKFAEHWGEAAVPLDDDAHDPDAITSDPLLAMVESFFAHDTWDQQGRLDWIFRIFMDKPRQFIGPRTALYTINTAKDALKFMKETMADLHFDLIRLAHATLNVRFLEYYQSQSRVWFPNLPAAESEKVERATTIELVSDLSPYALLDDYFPNQWSILFERLIAYATYRPDCFRWDGFVWKMICKAPVAQIDRFLSDPRVVDIFNRSRTQYPLFAPIVTDRKLDVVSYFGSRVSVTLFMKLFGRRDVMTQPVSLVHNVLDALTLIGQFDLFFRRPNSNFRMAHLIGAIIELARYNNPSGRVFRWVDFLESDAISVFTRLATQRGFLYIYSSIWARLAPVPIDTFDDFLGIIDKAPLDIQHLYLVSLSPLLNSVLTQHLVCTNTDAMATYERDVRHIEERQLALLV